MAEAKQAGERKRVPVITRKGGSVVVKSADTGPEVKESKPLKDEPAAETKGE